MDGHEHEQVSDQTLDRQIAAALAVEPSPEFRARVRARVATDKVHVAWWRSPTWAGFSIAMVTVGVIAGWIGWNRAVVDAPRASAGTTVETTPALVAGDSAPPVVRVERLDARQTARRESPVAPRRALASRREVIVSPDDASALRHLVTAIATRQLDAGDIPPLRTESVPLPPIDEIVLEPIKLSPIAGLESE